jgi:DNA processing protein
MSARPENSDNAVLTLGLLEVPGVGDVGARRILARLVRDGRSAGSVLAEPQLLAEILPPDRIESFRKGASSARSLLDEVAEDGARVIAVGDPLYPRRLDLLGDHAPLFLMARGNLNLLRAPGVGFCGSRKASEKGLAVASDVAEQLAGHAMNAVSGYAAGVDTTVHEAALRGGGTTTVVLPLGILHFKVKNELRPVWDWDRILVVSEFPARLPWKGRNAMRRNATICALSDALVVIEAGSSGGTIEAGKTGLSLGIPVLAVQYNGDRELAPGNEVLVGLGAHKLGRSRETGRANVDRVLGLAHTHHRGHPTLF